MRIVMALLLLPLLSLLAQAAGNSKLGKTLHNKSCAV